MAFDRAIAECVRELLHDRAGFSERKMFGGVCYMLRGNMCCGVVGTDLVLRLGDEGVAAALNEPHTRPMDFTGRALKSMLYLSSEGYADDANLASWVERATRFAESLPPK